MSVTPAEAQSAESPFASQSTVTPKAFVVRDAVLALSIAHLSLIQAAHGLLFERFAGYFNKLAVNRASLAALLLNIFGLGFVLWLIGRVIRRVNSRLLLSLTSLAICAVAIIPLNFARTHFLYFGADKITPLVKQPLIVVAAIGIALAVAWFHRHTARFIMGVYLILSPMVIFTVAKCAWYLVVPPHAAVDSLAPASAPKAGPRIVWVLLDELDQRLSLEERPADIAMSELTRFSNESFHATNAFPPGGATVFSLPALTIGREVRDVREINPSELTFNGNVRWSQSETVFSRARSLGFSTAVVGWLHPYGRVLGRHLERCDWYPYPPFEEERGTTIGEAAVNQLWSIFSQLQQRRLHIRNVEGSHAAATKFVTESPAALTMLHLPMPHSPGIYDAKRERFTIWKFSRTREYFENLALTDKLWRELRRAMEKAGTWDNTWVIVSSDHWWRESAHYDGKTDHRVPFIVKAPGQNQSATYDKKFNTVVSYHLILSILKGELNSATELPQWLDNYRSDPPRGYTATGEPF
jgi:hypothetical protein